VKNQFGSKVLEAWFAPAVLLMSRLTYVRKFAVATALFAVPLLFVVINESVEHFEKIKQLEKKYIAIERLADIHQISRDIASLRNERARMLLLSQRDLEESVVKRKNMVLASLKLLEVQASISEHNLIKLAISSLASSITIEGRVSGSEGDSIYSIFDNINRVVGQAHRLGGLVVAEAGGLNDEDLLSLNIVSLLINDMEKPLENFGKAETIGGYFLNKGFIGSQGVQALSTIANQLDESYLNLNQHLESIFDRFEFANRTKIIDISLLEAISRLRVLEEDSIMLDPDLSTSEELYREGCQRQLADLYLFQDQLVEFLLHRYRVRIDILKKNQWQRSLSVSVIVFVAMYLFMGIFFSVENSLLQLIAAAKRVSSGDLDTKVTVKTRDELFQLACVFEEMRMQLKARDKMLFDLTITDGLTGLFNRKYFNDCISAGLKNASRAKSPLTLLIIDIDFFKKINDDYGHQIGDKCLVEMGNILMSVLKRETDAAFRYGGEEFAIILPNMSSKNCLIMVKAVWTSIRLSMVMVDDKALSFTASIGVASTDTLGSYEVYDMVQAADKALYEAKDNGRDCYVVHSSTGIHS